MNQAGQADELPVTGSSTAAAALGDASSAPPALLLTIEEAAERLQVGRCTMQALLLSGEVQSFKIGRLRRVPPGALEDYIARQMAR
jgi:excisionase family DNA binding protein